MADFVYPTTADAAKLDANYITNAKARKAGKMPADGFPGTTSSTPKPKPKPRGLTPKQQAGVAKAFAKTAEVSKKEEIMNRQRQALIDTCKKIERYKKRFPEKLAPLKLKSKYTTVQAAQADYARIKDFFCETDPEPTLCMLYGQAADYSSRYVFPQIGINAPQYGMVVKNALTPTSPGFNKPLKDVVGEISCEYASYFSQSMWKRFIGANVMLVYQLHTANIMSNTTVSQGLKDKLSAFSKSTGTPAK
jgi:hypothetical protein